MSEPRRVQLSEIEGLADLITPVFEFDKSYTRKQIIRGLRRPAVRRDTVIMAEDGKPVSHIRFVYERVSVYGCEIKVASIGAVSTHPDYRGRGHAGAILDLGLREMHERSAKVLIVSGNRDLYRRVHCAPAGRVYETVFRPPMGTGTANGAEPVPIRKVTADDWPILAPLHQSESVRFLRPDGFMSRSPFWWDCSRPEIWLIESGNKPVAYVMLSLGWPLDPTSRTREVHEYAGSRAALLDALPAICSVAGLDEIGIRALGYDTELIYLLRQRGFELHERTLGGTHRIIDLPGLMKALRPYLAERLTGVELRRLSFGQTETTSAVCYGEERIEMPLSQAAPLMLGGPGGPALSGDLGQLLSAIFPIPFPMPGFNYV